MNTTNPYDTPESEFIENDITEFSDVKFFGFSGRLGRIRYLAYVTIMYIATLFIALICSSVLGGIVAATSGATAAEPPIAGAMVVAIVAVVFYVAMIIYMFSLIVRRLHDIDWSGWASLLMIIPVVNLVMMLVILFVPGTKGVNRFGNQTPPNSALITVVGLAMPIIMVVGILAAVALPAYQEYTVRAQQHQQQMLEE